MREAEDVAREPARAARRGADRDHDQGRAAALGLILAACSYHAGVAAGDADTLPRDTAPSDVAPDAPACAVDPGTIHEAFASTGILGCPSWAATTAQSATVAQANHQLVITPNMFSPGAHGNCTENGSVPFGAAGVFVEVETAPSAASAYAYLAVYGAPSGLQARFTVKGGQLQLLPATAAYDPSAMKWLRLRPDPTGIVGDYSADATVWTHFAVVSGAAPAMVRIDLGAGTDNAEMSPGVATFSHLDVCP